MSAIKHITFIVNPVAGRGKTKHLAEQLEKLLRNSLVRHSIIETQYPKHGTELARQASNNSDVVVAVGGDGTVNEVAAGLLYTNSILGVLSEGSGNDFARLVNAPSNIEHAIEIFTVAQHKKFDAGKVLVTFENRETEQRYFFNTIGLGFDAAVAKHVAQITWLRGLPLYGAALIQTLIGYQPHTFEIISAEKKLRGTYFAVCVGNGPWEGGGFKVTPNAIPDDGVFQVCCIAGNSVLNVLPVLPFTLNGSHITKKNVTTFNSQKIRIIGDKKFSVHGDGEIFGTEIIEVEIELLPQSLNVAVAHK